MSGPTPMDIELSKTTSIHFIKRHMIPTRTTDAKQFTTQRATRETDRQHKARHIQMWLFRTRFICDLFINLNAFLETDVDIEDAVFATNQDLATINSETKSIPITDFINTGEFAAQFHTLCQNTGVPSIIIESFTHHGVREFLKHFATRVEILVEEFYGNVPFTNIFPQDVANYLLTFATHVASFNHHTLQTHNITPFVRFVALLVMNMRDADDLKHGPENEIILFAFAKIIVLHSTCPLFANIQNDAHGAKLTEIVKGPSCNRLIMTNLVVSLMIRLHQAIQKNDKAHRMWTMKIYFLLYAMKLSGEYQSEEFLTLCKGYAWLTVATNDTHRTTYDMTHA